MKKKSNWLIIGVMAVVLFLGILGVVTLTEDTGKTNNQIVAEDATATLSRLLKKVDIETVEPRKSPIMDAVEGEIDELPSIDENPLMVKGNGDLDIEIFSSPEKAGEGTDGWLNEVAKKFNAEKYEINGQTISVSIRKVDSGLGVEYIQTGKYLPDAFSPSNELWGEMLKAKNIDIELKTERLVGNTAGILLKKEVYDEMVKKYGSINLRAVVEATSNNEIIMGYTNPLASSAGLNFILTTLYNFDPQNPFSEEATEGFMSFQANVPFVAQTTMQIRESALGGSLDGLIIESQSYLNLPELRDFVFTP